MAVTTGEKLYLNEEQKDVVFLVGPDEQHRVRFPAHKLILSSFSPVFANMLSERFQEGRTGEVVITDVTPAAFRNVLQFAYAGTIQIPSVVTFKEILYAAHKYLMVDLSKFCFDHLENFAINLDNFWDFFNIVCTFYSEFMSPKIVINTFQFLDEHAEKLLSNDEFRNLNSEAVLRIVTRNSLCDTSEITILQQVFQWSKVECCRQNLEVTVENERIVLEKIKYDIRYLLIPRNQMLNDVITQVILTESEKKILLDGSLLVNGTLPLPWNNILLSVPRGLTSDIKFYLDSGDHIVSPTDIFAIDLLLVVANDCVFQSLRINCFLKNSDLKITADITDLNGNIHDTWLIDKTGTNAQKGLVPIGKPICLQKWKSYKLSLVCVTGHFERKYDNCGFCNDPAGRPYFFLSNFPTDAAVLHDMKSSNYWERAMSCDSSMAHVFESIHNNFVKSLTLII